MVNVLLVSAVEQLASLMECERRPFALDDYTLRALRMPRTYGRQ